MCTYATSLEQSVGLTRAVYVCISNTYVQILTPSWGHRLYVYACICTYFCQYFGENTFTYIRSQCCHGCFVFIGAGAGLCTFAARSLQQVRLAAPAERRGGFGTCVQSKAVGTSTQHQGGPGTHLPPPQDSAPRAAHQRPVTRMDHWTTLIPATTRTTRARLPILQLLYKPGRTHNGSPSQLKVNSTID